MTTRIDGAQLRCPLDSRQEGDLVGCGSANIVWDAKDQVWDCLDCGLWFTREGQGRDYSPATPSPAPEPPQRTLEPAEHGPGCSCCDCLCDNLHGDPHDTDCTCEACWLSDQAERARWDELNEGPTALTHTFRGRML